MTYRSSHREAVSLVQELTELGVHGEACRADFANPESGVRATMAAMGRRPVDVLVLNASAYQPDAATPRAQAMRLRQHLEVNAIAPILLARAMAPKLAASTTPGGGSIVAMGDIHAMGRPRGKWSAYLASKGALHAAMESLAIDLAPAVRVNLVAPGLVAAPGTATRAEVASYLKRVPLARAGTPADAADAVAWLALTARYVTGQVIRVDGGRWLR